MTVPDFDFLFYPYDRSNVPYFMKIISHVLPQDCTTVYTFFLFPTTGQDKIVRLSIYYILPWGESFIISKMNLKKEMITGPKKLAIIDTDLVRWTVKRARTSFFLLAFVLRFMQNSIAAWNMQSKNYVAILKKTTSNFKTLSFARL